MCADGVAAPYPAASAAVSTDGPDEAVDGLEGTQSHLHQAHDQDHAEQSHMPRHHSLRSHTQFPRSMVGHILSTGVRQREISL